MSARTDPCGGYRVTGIPTATKMKDEPTMCMKTQVSPTKCTPPDPHDSAKMHVPSDYQLCHRHRSATSADDDNSRIGHVVSARAVGFYIVADLGVFGNTDVLIQDSALHLGVAADIAVIHDDAAFHEGAGVDPDAA